MTPLNFYLRKVETESGTWISSLEEGLSLKCYLSDKAVRGGVRRGASVRALKSALPLGVLSLKTEMMEGSKKVKRKTQKV